MGIDLGREPAPDETTVGKFRHLLEEHHLGGAPLDVTTILPRPAIATDGAA